MELVSDRTLIFDLFHSKEIDLIKKTSRGFSLLK